MIRLLLQPLVCERFLTDARYLEGHLRVVNALPERRVVGLHSPEIKAVTKQLSREGGKVSSCDMPFNEDFGQFGSDYLRLTQQVRRVAPTTTSRLAVWLSALRHWRSMKLMERWVCIAVFSIIRL